MRGLLVAFVISVFFIYPQLVEAAIITVPGDYSTIQEAIDASTEGDVISVLSGTYEEDLVIDKWLTLAGHDATIVGSGTGDVITIISDKGGVTGFTVKGSGSDYISPFEGGDAGIKLQGVKNCVVSGNELTGDGIGIFLNMSDGNRIDNNIIYEQGKDGIYGRYSNNNTIRGNNVRANGGHGGIYLNPENSYNLIENNLCLGNVPEHGIKIQTNSNYNIIRNNTCLYNGDGIYLSDVFYNEITNNICSNSSERNGIMIRLSENNIISGNTIEYNPDHGLDLDFLNFNNTLKDNICSHNVNGIALRLGSHNNKIINNKCNYNERSGIEIEHSDYNEITNNDFSMNSNGINIVLIDSNPDNEWNSVIQWDYAMDKFKELVEEREARGLNIGSDDSIGNEFHWNTIEGNTDFGINSDILSEVDVTNNWWGDASGPFHNQNNQNGKGNEIQAKGGEVAFEPWLDSHPTGEEVKEPETPPEVTPPDIVPPETDGEVQGDNTYLIYYVVVIIVVLVIVLVGYKKFK
jgi:parallel beta-helix repeat protein